MLIRYHNRGCAQQRKFLETIQSIESILTQFRDINMWCQNVIFQKSKDGAQPRKFFEKLYNFALFREHFHQYFEMLLNSKLLNLKTFKDFSLMQNQRLLKTFGRH